MLGENKQGIIYVLSNPSMPRMLKIGKTLQNDVKIRIDELSRASSVPLPFDCKYAAKVKNIDEVEKALHTAFSIHRVNPKREFFEIESYQAIAILKLLEVENVTPKILKQEEDDKTDIIEKEASKEFQKKRPNFNFLEMGIPVGSKIYSNLTDDIAEVIDQKKIKFRNEVFSLTAATHICLGLGDDDHNRAPGPYWTFNGKKLSDIYNETYLLE